MRHLNIFIKFLFLLFVCEDSCVIGASIEKVVSDNFGGNCNRDSLAVYKVELEGNWNEQAFPKHYPKFRPHAHFSKSFGVTHNESFELFSIGSFASNGLSEFCSSASVDSFELTEDIFDEFTIPKLENPEHKIGSIQLFVNSNFSVVSLVTKLLPSPDWIIGLKSLKLCRNDRWIEKISIESRLFDCGINSGFTFSSPIFKTNPQEKISEITPNSPNHDASSFYYADKKNLPAIAYYRFHKIKEYVGVKETSVKRIHQKYRRHDQKANRRHRRKKNKSRNEVRKVTNENEQQLQTNAVGGNGDDHESPDCILSAWKEWSLCSTSCGIGQMFRNRAIVKLNKKGGMPCGQLTERKWCGSSRCKDDLNNDPISNSSYFRW